MTNEEAANELISMYALYRAHYPDTNSTAKRAVTIAVAALSESAGRDACAECREEHGLLGRILDELKAIRSILGTTK